MTVTVEQPTGSTGNYFEVTAAAGQTAAAGNLMLKNQTGDQITVLLDPVQGLTASTLGSAYGLRGSKQSGSSGWVVLGSRRVTLGPHAGTQVPVSVRVPGGAGPGEYLAGVGVQPAGPGQNVQLKGNVAISQVERYAVGVLTRIPGPLHPAIKLTGVGLSREPSGVTFQIRGRNTGNEILKNVHGVATISQDGDQVARRKLGPGTFVTGTSIAYPLLVPSLRPSAGTAYRVQALLRYPGGVARIDRVVHFGEIDARRQAAYGGPQVNAGGGSNKLIPIIILALLLIAGALAVLRLRRRRLGCGEAALRRALPGEISRAQESGEPLSVTLVPVDNGHRPAKLAAGVRESLRPRDRLFHLDSGLIVVSPSTTPESGEMLAADIRRNLARGGFDGGAVIPITSAAESSAAELLEAAEAVAADASVVGGGNGDGNGGNGQNGETVATAARHRARAA